MPKGKLELTWVGKDERPRLEPRVLVEDPSKSYGDLDSENMLIYGDNLLALKALEQDLSGKLKCICIDPPYNTGAAFREYDDGIEHSLWLTMMRDRLEILKKLLRKDGSIWICIDDNEGHYLKILCDEVFGRACFVATVIWRSTDNSNNDAKQFSVDHNMILVYSREPGWRSKRLPPPASKRSHFKNPDGDSKGPYFDGNPISSPNYRANLCYPLLSPQGHAIQPPKNGWRWSKERMQTMIRSGEVRFTPDGKGIRRRTYLANQKGLPPSTLWADLDDTGHNRQAKYEQKKLFPDRSKEEWFGTPKPEKLIRRILELSTEPSDWVLDSFAGSGTTSAVAHKMGRRWIMCELGDHCHTHIIPRMKKVIDGGDLGGISKTSKSTALVSLCKGCRKALCESCAEKIGETEKGGKQTWFGGGGFKYYRLGESLLVRDKDLSTKDNPVYIINPRYDDRLLIRAICKIENFRYRNEGRLHGISSESRFLHVTTRLVTQAYLDALAEDIGSDQSLLIYCTRKSRALELPDNIEVKKIPRDLLDRCDFEEDK